MRAVVLAAGVGQRLRGLLDNIPKPMANVLGKPILEHNIEWLKKFGVTDIFVNLHYLPECITGYFGDGSDWNVHITYSHEKELLGTAGAVKKISWKYWNDEDSEPFLVVYGDNILSDFDLTRIIKFHKTNPCIATICLYRKPEEVYKSGVAVINEHSRILRFIEKPAPGQITSDLVNTGIYVLEPVILKYIPESGSCDFARDVFPKVLDDGKQLNGFVFDANLIAIDTPQLFRKNIDLKVTK